MSQLAARTFTITTEYGTTRYTEGQAVPPEVARQFPQFMVGQKSPVQKTKHNPKLPSKLTKTAANALSGGDLVQWITQNHPTKLPNPPLDKAGLVELVMALQAEE